MSLEKEFATLSTQMEKVCREKEVVFCNSLNLTPVEFKCIRNLLNNDFIQVKDLAKFMDLTPARVTNLLNSLEKKGYVIREISPNDRRIIEVKLTKKGKEFAKDLEKRYIEFHKELLNIIDDKNKLESLLYSLKVFQNTIESFLENHKENR